MLSLLAAILLALAYPIPTAADYVGPETVGMIFHQPTELGFPIGHPQLLPPATQSACLGCWVVTPATPFEKINILDWSYSELRAGHFDGLCTGTPCVELHACSIITFVTVKWVSPGNPPCAYLTTSNGADEDYFWFDDDNSVTVTFIAWAECGGWGVGSIYCGSEEIARQEVRCFTCF